jgi:hypothetical protein
MESKPKEGAWWKMTDKPEEAEMTQRRPAEAEELRQLVAEVAEVAGAQGVDWAIAHYQAQSPPEVAKALRAGWIKPKPQPEIDFAGLLAQQVSIEAGLTGSALAAAREAFVARLRSGGRE